ncbi:HMA2 domain-containing protein [Aquabacter sp. CN5-332]|uniref:HMA2 domain-containing protein n=1 Tax=Aquabacter sp. CN5-332 TaxID=3156608 RepID=UPI0032B3EF15
MTNSITHDTTGVKDNAADASPTPDVNLAVEQAVIGALEHAMDVAEKDIAAVEIAAKDDVASGTAARDAAAVDGSPAQPAAGKPARPRKHKLKIVHKVPGRIRLKVPHGKSQPELLTLYQDIFSKVPGISSVKTKPESGSVIINYDVQHEGQFAAQFGHICSQHRVEHAPRPGDEIHVLASKIEAEAEFLAERSEFARNTVQFFKKLDYELKSVSGNTVDLKIVLVGGLAAYTFFELGAGAATPMWATLALFSFNHLAELHTQHSPAPAYAAR